MCAVEYSSDEFVMFFFLLFMPSFDSSTCAADDLTHQEGLMSGCVSVNRERGRANTYVRVQNTQITNTVCFKDRTV